MKELRVPRYMYLGATANASVFSFAANLHVHVVHCIDRVHNILNTSYGYTACVFRKVGGSVGTDLSCCS